MSEYEEKKREIVENIRDRLGKCVELASRLPDEELVERTKKLLGVYNKKLDELK